MAGNPAPSRCRGRLETRRLPGVEDGWKPGAFPVSSMESEVEDGELKDLLREVGCIAVVGMKDGQADDAFRVPRYLQMHGYRILPVNPKLEQTLGERAYASLADVPTPIDLVNLFRAPAFVPGHAEEILGLQPRPRAVWMQLGIAHPESASRLRAAGIAVVEDRCIMVEHRRLLGVA